MSSFTSPLEYEPIGTRTLDGNPEYRILKEFQYCVGSLNHPIAIINVPEGFITDFATIPWPLNYFFKPDGKWAKAAIIHDYLYIEYYKRRDFTKVVADAIFYEAMLVLKINMFIALLFYFSTRLANTWKLDG